MDLEPGDEIGLFDMNGVVETALAGEEPVYGEVLVGSGVWMGDQLNLVAIGSVDTSEFGGPVLNGFVSGNDIMSNVWKSSENEVYDAVATYSAGNGTFGQILTAVSLLEPVLTVTQDLVMNPYQMNYVSMCVTPEDNSTSALLGGTDLLIVSNDASDYYVPSFNVDQIATLESDEAFSCFLNGGVNQTLYVQGLPIDILESI